MGDANTQGEGSVSRQKREEVFSPDEIACVHVMNRVVRQYFLLGKDPVSGKNFNHRKQWMEMKLQSLAAYFAIDILGYTILDNHFHLILRSRPDVVSTWADTEVARRWLMICPKRKHADGTPKEPKQSELNVICNKRSSLKEIRSRLSDISWWMRLLCQYIAQKANAETKNSGKFWQDRFKAVRLLDEISILAAAAYVDLNPVRAALTEAIETSDFTSVKKRIENLLLDSIPMEQTTASSQGLEPNHAYDADLTADANASRMLAERLSAKSALLADRLSALRQAVAKVVPTEVELSNRPRSDGFLAPVFTGEGRDDALGSLPSSNGRRCSDKGFLNMSIFEYIELLDWTARRVVADKRGSTPQGAPRIFERLGVSEATWLGLIRDFGRLFFNVAGEPSSIAQARGLRGGGRYRVRETVKQVFAAA